MKRIIAALLALALALPAFGRNTGEPNVFVFTNPYTGARLQILADQPCSDPAILQHVPMYVRPHLGAATAQHLGEEFSLCFFFVDEGEGIRLVAPNGEVSDTFPIRLFSRASTL